MAGVVDQQARRKGLSIVDSVDAPDSLRLQLTIEDRDTIDDLLAFPSGGERESFALNALRIGVLALRQARGRIDADLIQRETQRMLTGLEGQLSAHAAQMQDKLATSLKEYFDPQSGRLHERVQQLIKQDGELEQVLRRQIGGEDSELCKTLLGHFGQQSPLMKLLNPSESEGLLMALRQTVESQLTAQRNHVLKEFSLDNKEGALARMICELNTSHGQLTDALQKKIDTVVGEFSLDKEDSALNRLVRNVDRAQNTITREFSLDDDDSSLARLRRELMTVLEKHTATNSAFPAGATFTVTANATNGSGTVVSTTLFRVDNPGANPTYVPLASAATNTVSLVFSNATAQVLNLAARTSDNFGFSAESVPIRVTVYDAAHLSLPQIRPDGTVSVQFTGTFTALEVTSDFLSWSSIDPTFGTDGTLQWIDTGATNQTMRFYRGRQDFGN